MGDSDDRRVYFEQVVGALGSTLLGALATLERAARRLHPPALASLRDGLAPTRDELRNALEAFAAREAPEGLAPLRDALGRAAEQALSALSLLVDPPSRPEEGVPRVLEAMRLQCRALETLYPLHALLPPVSRFFLEPAARDRWREYEAQADGSSGEVRGPGVGMHRAGGQDPDARGGFRLYVPERYDAAREWPLVVALHGGFGHGRDFLWTWVREARTRGVLLLAPTSRDTTWSLHGPDRDAASLESMVEFVAERWRVDRGRILLTGLSDGATYSLLCGLREGSPFTHLAPLSGVLHPANFHNGNLARARERPIYLVHGALDWMFPVAIARMARDELEKAGARLVYREIDDLSHAYAREENARILEWLDPRLQPAGRPAASDAGAA